MEGSVVVFDADVFGALRTPCEGDAPWVVDADGVAVLAVSQQGTKAVGWGEAESFKGRRGGKFAKASAPMVSGASTKSSLTT